MGGWDYRLQARLQQYVNQELPNLQAGLRKGRGTRDQIANFHGIIKKAKGFQKNICFFDDIKAFDCVDHHKMWKILQEMGNTRPPHLPPEKSVWRSRSNGWKGHGTMDWFLIEKGVYFHLVYLTYMQSIS